MANLRTLLFFLLVSAIIANGQNAPTPRVELFGGYSLLHTPTAETTFHGWNSAVNVNLNRWLGVKAESSAVYFDNTSFYPADDTGRPDRTLRSFGSVDHFVFGPSFTIRRWSRYDVFVHTLFGITHGLQHNVLTVPGGSTSFDGTTNEFASVLGGGVNIGLSRHMTFRPIQADYVLDRFHGLNVNRFRYSTGMVFRFGKL